MSGLVTPRMGRAIERVLVDSFGAVMLGERRGERNIWLIVARNSEGLVRKQRIRFAIDAHRSMMSYLREYRRNQHLQVAA